MFIPHFQKLSDKETILCFNHFLKLSFLYRHNLRDFIQALCFFFLQFKNKKNCLNRGPFNLSLSSSLIMLLRLVSPLLLIHITANALL